MRTQVLATAVGLSALLPVFAQDASHDKIGLELLRAMDYADIVRVVAKRDCADPAKALRLPFCSKIDRVPKLYIERAALPYLKRHVSVSNAKAALEFWSSQQGAKISKTLVKEIAGQNPTSLSQTELDTLDKFNKSEPGVALSNLGSDRDLGVGVLRAIGNYAP